MERKGNYIQTFTGIRFYPFDPLPSEISIQDIAQSLANLCRFTGHTDTFYSVAQHSVLCSYKASEGNELFALLHDASEAYLGDIARPIKILDEMAFYRSAEKKLQELIYLKFCKAINHHKLEIKAIDDKMLFTEKRDLLGIDLNWGYEIEPYPEKIQPVSANKAKLMFLNRFHELCPF